MKVAGRKWVAGMVAVLVLISCLGTERKTAADELSLIGNVLPTAVVENGILYVSVSGNMIRELPSGAFYWPQLKLPPALGFLLNDRSAISMRYTIPDVQGGTFTRTMNGQELFYERANQVVRAQVPSRGAASIGGRISFMFMFDLNRLGQQLPPGAHSVYLMVSEAQISAPSLESLKYRTVIGGAGGDVGLTETGITILPFNAPPPVIVDPENPGQVIEPAEPATGDTGPLTLDHVSSIEFGTQAISGMAAVYSARTLRPFIQVTDRRGTGEGWRLTAEAGRFRSGVDPTLPGAALEFMDGSAVTGGTSAPPSVRETIRLVTGGEAVLIASAAPGSGLGTWSIPWLPDGGGEPARNDKVTLTVPGGAATQGGHSALITWTLVNAP
jgi:hypothetical protein